MCVGSQPGKDYCLLGVCSCRVYQSTFAFLTASMAHFICLDDNRADDEEAVFSASWVPLVMGS